MKGGQINPFEITKAVDFTDKQITEYWVDISGAGFQKTIKPASPMPMIILGGKGSGKTHLMRYFSYASQKIRYSNILAGIQEDGYVGIYMRCGGLNASRFGGGEKDHEKWSGVFSYYMDLWLSQITIKTIIDLFESTGTAIEAEREICRDIYNIFSGVADVPAVTDLSLNSLLLFLIETQKKIDVAVNNYPFSESLEVDIATSPGELVFAVPEILTEYIPELEGVLFSYFIDEFENLADHHQRYINTLIREKRLPCSFKIGSRLYGIKTYETYSAGETNKVGSEYDRLHLDSILRSQSKTRYRKFGKSLCLRRLAEANYIFSDDCQVDGGLQSIDFFFDTYAKDRFSKEATKFVLDMYLEKARPYISKLRKKLSSGYKYSETKIREDEYINTIIENISCKEIPILEKANIFLLYQDWYKNKKNLLTSSETIKEECSKFKETGELGHRHYTAINHFGSDLLAQLIRECGKKQIYLGMNTFIDMSSGLPRNLLIILKHVFQWSLYNGEHPFRDNRKISMQAQRKGVMEAADWFFRDARMSGVDGKLVRAGMSNLATLLRRIRFSDKPTECSLSTFSVNTANISSEALRVIELAENWSLLINIPGGRRDRNSGGVNSKYQINPMLVPMWDLPTSRRGVLALRPGEVDSIFDEKCRENFEKITKIRVARMTAPTFKVTPELDGDPQVSFPEFYDV